MKKIGFVAATAILVATAVVRAESIPTKVAHEDLPEAKQTVAELYVTAPEAYNAWEKDHNIKILDVRTIAEYAFVGHPEMAYNVPLKFATRRFDSEAGHYALEPNEKFLEQVAKVIKPDDVVLVTCRSGQRSAEAVNMLTKAGYKKAYSIVDGFEGDKVKDPGGELDGKREKNGWRKAGLPWTYDLDPELIHQGE